MKSPFGETRNLSDNQAAKIADDFIKRSKAIEERKEMDLARKRWEQEYMEQLELSKRFQMSKKSAELTMRNAENMELIENRTRRVLAKKEKNIAKLTQQVKMNDDNEIILAKKKEKEKLQGKVKTNTKEFEDAYARKLAKVEEKKKWQQAELEKKKKEEEDQFLFQPQISHKKNISGTRSQNKDTTFANSSPHMRSPHSTRQTPQQKSPNSQNRVEDRLLKQGHDKQRKLETMQYAAGHSFQPNFYKAKETNQP